MTTYSKQGPIFAVSFKTLQDKEKMFFLPSFLWVVPRGLRKPLSVFSGIISVFSGIIREMQKSALHNPSALHSLSALLSSSKERRNEEQDTCPLLIPFAISPAEPKLANEEVIYTDTQGTLSHQVSYLRGGGGNHPERPVSPRVPCTFIAWTGLAKRPVLLLLQTKRDQVRRGSSDVKCLKVRCCSLSHLSRLV